VGAITADIYETLFWGRKGHGPKIAPNCDSCSKDGLGREKFFRGLGLFQLHPDGIQSIGRVTHCVEGKDWPLLERAIIMGDFLYTLSDAGLKIDSLRNPVREQVSLEF